MKPIRFTHRPQILELIIPLPILQTLIHHLPSIIQHTPHQPPQLLIPLHLPQISLILDLQLSQLPCSLLLLVLIDAACVVAGVVGGRRGDCGGAWEELGGVYWGWGGDSAHEGGDFVDVFEEVVDYVC